MVASGTAVVLSTNMPAIARAEVDRSAYPRLSGDKLEEKLDDIYTNQKCISERLQLLTIEIAELKVMIRRRDDRENGDKK